MISTSNNGAAVPPRPTSTLRFDCAGGTDKGMERPHNEDRFGIYPDLGLCIVADGMGGAAAGEVAARLTVELTREELVEGGAVAPSQPGADLAALIAAIRRANARINDVAQGTPAWRGMGSTIAAVLAHGQRAVVAHVGDSRIYRLRGPCLTQLTEDHSLFNTMVRAGLADPEHPEQFARHHLITRAVGTAPSVDVDARVIYVSPGDTILLCSDGLSGVVAAQEIAEVLVREAHVEDAVRELIARANRHGGPDNITAIVMRAEAFGGGGGQA